MIRDHVIHVICTIKLDSSTFWTDKGPISISKKRQNFTPLKSFPKYYESSELLYNFN